MSHEELETKFLQGQIDTIAEKILHSAVGGRLQMKWYLSHMYNMASVEKIHLLKTPSHYLDYIVAELKRMFPDATIRKNGVETYIRIDWS